MCWKTGDKTDSLGFILVWYFVPQGETDSSGTACACAVNSRFCFHYCLSAETNLSWPNSTCIPDSLFLHFKLTALWCSVKVWAAPITK